MEQTPKQQVAENLRDANNVLVTVSSNPSVDELAAALGLTFMLDALGKHVTAVFSGNMPDVLSFLEPEKTFESSVDGLRDFIILLDRNKATRIRHKVEDDIVKLFITPSKNKLSKEDLQFSQGDFNVDTVVALGAKEKGDLDKATASHGRILHDATVIAITTGNEPSKLGAINWTEENASCLCEMLVSISESLQGNLLDEQMSTALLTGIVSATDRFSNENTTPKVMTMSAQLMANGANQQLIANNLNIKNGVVQKKQKDDSEFDLGSKEEKPKDKKPSDSSKQNAKPDESKEKSSDEDTADKKPESGKKDNAQDDSSDDKDNDKLDALQKELAQPEQPKKLPKVDFDDLDSKDQPLGLLETEVKLREQGVDLDLDSTVDNILKPPQEEPKKEEPAKEAPAQPAEKEKPSGVGEVKGMGPRGGAFDEPVMGGTFNATSIDARKEADRERQQSMTGKVLQHRIEPTNEQMDELSQPEQPAVPDNSGGEDHIDAARQAVEAAMQGTNYSPSNQPLASVGAQTMDDESSSVDLNGSPAGGNMPQQQIQQPAPMPQQSQNSAPAPMPMQAPFGGGQPVNAPAPMPGQAPMPPQPPQGPMQMPQGMPQPGGMQPMGTAPSAPPPLPPPFGAAPQPNQGMAPPPMPQQGGQMPPAPNMNQMPPAPRQNPGPAPNAANTFNIPSQPPQ